MIAGGTIAGRVTARGTGAAIGGVEVCVYLEEAGELEYDGCEISAGDGSYEISELRAGPHLIEIWAFEAGYENTSRGGIPILAGNTLNLDALLVRAEGRINGHLYSAATREPLAGVAVCAIVAGTGWPGGCAHTGKSGGYEFFPVEAGDWKIVFSPEPDEVEEFEGVEADAWPTQFWNGQASLAAATVLTVTPTTTITGIDAFLGPGPKLEPPPPTGGSGTATGTPAVPGPPPAPKQATVRPVKEPKPLHCRKGEVKKRVKGKPRCVKRHKRHKHRRHHKSGHGKKRHQRG